MDKKTAPLKSKAQAGHLYREYKAGKVSYPDMMKAVHATDFSKIPDRVKEKSVDKKTDVAIKGLI